MSRIRVPLLPLLAVSLLAACSTPPDVASDAAITSVSPASGSFATPIEVVGEGFGADALVEVCGVPLEHLDVDAAERGVVAGPHVTGTIDTGSSARGTLAGVAAYGACDVAVTNPGGTRVVVPEAFEHVRADTPAGELLARVLHADGTPAAGAAVTATPAEPGYALRATDATRPVARVSSTIDCGVTDGGGYVRCDLPAGDWTLLGSLDGFTAAIWSTTVGAAGGDAGDMRLAAPATLTVTVTNEHGPLGDAHVTLGGRPTVRTDAAGVATVAGLPAGTYTLRVAHDEHDSNVRPVELEAGATLSLNVELALLETIPAFISTPVTDAVEDAPYAYEVSAVVGEGTNLTITAPATLPAWLTLVDHGDGTATLSGTPTQHEVGSHEVRLIADDGVDTTLQAFTLTVTNVHDEPTFTSTPVTDATEDDAYTYAVTATDADGDALTFSLIDPPYWVALLDAGDGTATLVGTPDAGAVGTHDVSILLTDGTSSVTQDFVVTVASANVAPVIHSFTSHVSYVYGAGTVIFSWTASDPNGNDTVTCHFDSDNGSGQVSVPCVGSSAASYSAPMGSYVGYEPTITITDDEGLTASETLLVHVDGLIDPCMGDPLCGAPDPF